MVKVDSGPERLEIDFLAEAQTLGFIIYPSVPNTIAVTQETDQSYGPFKSKFVQNIRALSDAQINGDFPGSLLPWMVGLLVFGGTDPVLQFVVSESAFEFGFSWGKFECMEQVWFSATNKVLSKKSQPGKERDGR